jgi:hypothetical protein
MSISDKVKAGVLPFVIIISLVVSILCSALILLFYYHQIFILHYQVEQKLRTNASSGIHYAMATLEMLPSYEGIQLDLFDQMQDSVLIYKEPWGIFDLVKVTAFQGRHSSRKAAFLGATIKENSNALYLADTRRPLSIAGDALIVGNVSLPKAGVKAEYVDRIAYSRSKLIFGDIATSESFLPELHLNYRNRVQRLLQAGGKNEFGPFVKYLEQERPLYSFLHDSIVLHYSAESFMLKGGAEGKIVFKSEKEIRIHARSQLKDVIIIAPKIIIEDDVQGRFQAFATDTILIGENVTIQYPSTICVFSREGKGFIDIGPFSKVHGILCLLSGQEERNQGIVKIQEQAELMGQLFAEGFVQHQGIVKGTLYCQKFLLRTNASLYENYLFNGMIDRTKLPSSFVSTALLNPLNEKEIISWLY